MEELFERMFTERMQQQEFANQPYAQDKTFMAWLEHTFNELFDKRVRQANETQGQSTEANGARDRAPTNEHPWYKEFSRSRQ